MIVLRPLLSRRGGRRSSGRATAPAPGPAPLLVAIQQPAHGASVAAGAPVMIAGVVSDAGATVAVQLDGAALAAPAVSGGGGWSYSWTPTTGHVGARSIVAIATLGAASSSDSVTVHVTAPAPTRVWDASFDNTFG